MKDRTRADADARIQCAVRRAFDDPQPNPFFAAWAALWVGGEAPTDFEINATWGLVVEKLNAAARRRLEEQLRNTSPENKGKRKRLRAELRRGTLPPTWPAPAAPAIQPTDARRELLGSYTFDTDPQVFLRMYQEYERARREQRPIWYLVHRKGEPTTVELHAPPPPSPKPRRPRAGGAPRKLTPEEIRAYLKKHGPVGKGKTQAARAWEMGVTIRTLQNYQKAERVRVRPSSVS